MNAAVLHALGSPPRFEQFAEPVAREGEVLVHVLAAALHPSTRAVASDTHYASPKELPVIVGLDGCGRLDDGARVFFGAWVVLEAQDGTRARYRIVGPDEFDLAPGYISMDSPLARSLMRRSVDEEVTVEAPAGCVQYLIVSIEYEGAAS